MGGERGAGGDLLFVEPFGELADAALLLGRGRVCDGLLVAGNGSVLFAYLTMRFAGVRKGKAYFRVRRADEITSSILFCGVAEAEVVGRVTEELFVLVHHGSML